MIPALLAATARHRRPALMVAVPLGAGHTAVLWWWPWLFGLSVVLVVVLGGLMVVGWSQPRPSLLTVRPDRHVFEAPAGPGAVYAALCCLALATGQLGAGLRDLRAGRLGPFDLVWTLLWLLVAARWVFLTWDGLGVRLSPEGIRNRDVFGSIRVPWAALDPELGPVAVPRQSNVLLTYARPELVQRRGVVLSRRLLRADTVDAGFLARVLRYYLAHPADRAAIGTSAGRARLLRSVT